MCLCIDVRYVYIDAYIDVGCVGVYRGVVCVLCLRVLWEILSALAFKGQSGRTDLRSS